jgi:hypothetical protein
LNRKDENKRAVERSRRAFYTARNDKYKNDSEAESSLTSLAIGRRPVN